jgi:CheY-like chemotaxis protein
MAKVLIVDDEPDILLMLRVALESSGHDVALAADGEAGVAKIAAEDFDVVLCDVMMPVMDGWGVLAAVGAMPDAPPVVVVSAKSQPADIRRALDAGAIDFVTKPFSPFDLVELVEEIADLDDADLVRHKRLRYPDLT